MQWNEERLDTLFEFTLTKYANPVNYREFFDEFLKGQMKVIYVVGYRSQRMGVKSKRSSDVTR